MRKTMLCLPLVLLGAACGDDDGPTPIIDAPPGDPDAGAPAEKRLVIFHTNDEHSHLFGHAPEIDDWPPPTAPGDGDIVGGAARRSALLVAERAAAEAAGADHVTVSAGDETQGALPQIAFTTTAPDFTILNDMQYDVFAPGNHEFDRGPGAFAESIVAAMANGGIPQIVSTNIRFDDTDPADDSLAALYGEGDSNAPIKRYHVMTTPSGIKVGFFGVMGIEASYYAPFKVPVLFSADADEEGDREAGLPKLYAAITPTVEALRKTEQVDVVVMVSHGGVNTTDPTLGDDYNVAQNVPGIDIIVSGHSHTALEEPQMVEAPDGYTVPIVQAGSYGEWLGRAELVITEGERPQLDLDGTRLLHITDAIVPSDQEILAKLDEVVADLEANILPAHIDRIVDMTVTDDPAVLGDLYYYDMGMTTFDVIGRRAFVETNILNLSTDAMLAEAELREGPTLLAVQAAGAVRGDIIAGDTGVMSFADLYRIFPLGVNPQDGSIGYPLCRFYLWTVEIKAAFEVAASQGLVADSFFLSPSGIRVEIDTSRPPQMLVSPIDAFDPQNGRVTRISVDVDHSDGYDNPTVDLFDINRPTPWVSTLGSETTLHPVVTTLYIASFAEAAGVTLKNELNQPITLEESIMTRADGTDIKDWEVFMSYLYFESLANGGFLPSRYDENSAEGAIPRRMICSGPLCQ